VKGGDFSVDQLPKEERDIVGKFGGKIITIGFVPDKSTTALVERISQFRAGAAVKLKSIPKKHAQKKPSSR